MKKLNFLEIETQMGFRYFEVWQGDITQIPFSVDLLVISAFSRNYKPTRMSVIGTLKRNSEIDIQQLAESPLYDFRDSLGCWVSNELQHNLFHRILCVELKNTGLEVKEIFENLFAILSILEMKNTNIRSIALPVLGTGAQSFNPDMIINELLTCAKKHLNRSLYLERVVFVAYDEEHASQLNLALDKLLGRIKININTGILKDLRKDIINKLGNLSELPESSNWSVFNDMRDALSGKDIRFFEIGILARRFVEFIVDRILSATKAKSFELWKKIDELSHFQIADWIRSYMHLLRLFGNESAHEKNKEGRLPAEISQKDLELCLFCILRLLEFWQEWNCKDSRGR